jgi:glycosyltransferase involved in cell wall biosynthesis
MAATMTERPTLLAVSPFAPWPVRDGLTLRMSGLLKELLADWAVTLLAPHGPVPPGMPIEQQFAALPAVASTRPWRFDPGPLRTTLDRLTRERRFDAAVVWAGAEALWFGRPDLPAAVVDLIDCNALEFWREALTSRGLRLRLYNVRQLAISVVYAHRTFRSFAATVCIADTDAAWLRWFGGGGSVHVIPNGVAVPAEDPAPAELPVVSFTGSLDYHPNIDAALYAASQIWPRVRAAVPDAILLIAGRNPVAEIRALAGEPGIVVEADVPEMGAVLARSRACLAPMRAGSGLKNKVLEAWASARPVVMTPIATNGLILPPGHAALVHKGAAALAAAAVALLGKPGEADRLGAAARQHVRQHYTWQKQGERLSSLLWECLQRPRCDRPRRAT